MSSVCVYVSLRRLSDVVPSLVDHIDSSGACGGGYREPLGFNFLGGGECASWVDLSYERKVDYVIDIILPNHVRFIAGWLKARMQAGLSILLVTFEETVLGDYLPVPNLGFFGKANPSDRVSLLNAGPCLRLVRSIPKSNFNKGTSRRHLLTSRQLDRIDELIQWLFVCTGDVDVCDYLKNGSEMA